MPHKIAYLDCQAGVSGSLLLAAFVDLGVSVTAIQQQLQTLTLPGYELRCEQIQLGGLQGRSCHVSVLAEGLSTLSPSECVTLLETSSLVPQVRSRALSIMKRLFTAEESVRGKVGKGVPGQCEPVQALLEVLSVVSCLVALDVSQVYTSVLPLASGIVQTAVGLQAFPSPLTLELLRPAHALWQPSSQQGELVTPVAAALLADLALFEQPVMTIAQTGYGLTREQAQSSPRLAIYLGEQVGRGPASGGVETDQVTVIETHIDTMTGELLGALLDRLLEAGALDVGYTPLQMKKNCPGTRLTVICPAEIGEQLALLLLRETNTLGVRIQLVQRRKAQRQQVRVETPLGPMLIKIKSLGGEAISASPEYEECLRISKQRQLPLAEVYEVAHTVAQTLIIERKAEEKSI